MANELEMYDPKALESAAWLGKRDGFLCDSVKIVQVTNAQELDIAGKAETMGKKLISELEKMRKESTKYLDAEKKRLMGVEKDLVAKVSAEVDRLHRMNSDYATKVEMARQAELARIAAEERKAAEAAVAAEDDPFGLTEAPVTTAVPVSLMIEKAHTSTNRFVEKWDFIVYSPNDVPREFCSPDEKKIRQFLAAKKAEGIKANQLFIKGIKISMTMQSQSR